MTSSRVCRTEIGLRLTIKLPQEALLVDAYIMISSDELAITENLKKQPDYFYLDCDAIFSKLQFSQETSHERDSFDYCHS